MKKIIPIHKFTKTGFWLAVVDKGRSMYVVAAAKEPKKALEDAYKAGFKKAALMRSAKNYAPLYLSLLPKFYSLQLRALMSF